jgi:NADP-dependent aldehyde dehydrogenase
MEKEEVEMRDGWLEWWLHTAAESASRIIFNGVPTGVRVAQSMVHGGPFPATNRPDTTAVGPFAIERWCRPVCFQNAPQDLLPPELQDANPLGIMRLVNGEYTRGSVGKA